ncbi:P-loop NTPase fold protein [Nocardioides sp. C4-1]|uniref:KAP family P-loop NTPase fold protein n=1 Tax=Nocardioides sp. C4-1 TaxID=3151851 RepID=UPI0032669925
MIKATGRTAHEALLQSGDLIDDRELASPTEDRLDHDRVANELVDLVTTVATPTNVALYGPWGAGKSGVANLVRAKIADNKTTFKNVRFARFDAFKYAENPLRRNFISAIADELDVKNPSFSTDLYAGKTNTTVQVPNESKAAIAGWFLGLTVALVGVLCLVLAFLALFQSGSWGEAFSKNLSTALPGGLVPPALLAAVFTLVGKSLTVDRSVDKPESIEQFENLFKQLVEQSNADRLVIFVDELDRCSAKEVVATLDAIRTFLGVHKCVFIVAADQHVLEKALSEEARQETPDNSVNPYYSTGSAYLDKVFQYQVSLPSLLPQSVTGYAIGLVSGRTGLWSEIAPVDYPVSVLIPSHVTSPRRVKHLLNTFALMYRLAQSKHAAGRLRESPLDSIQALARLVCLRVEFPNFARDLTLDANLADYVLALYDDPDADLGDRVSRHVHERALAYATGQASPASLITGPSGSDAEDEQDDDGDDSSDSRASNSAEDDTKEADRDPGIRAQQGRQLITYLTRTRLVEGPSRDLIYLHSVEALYGLDDAISADLTPAVENGQHPEIARIFGDAPEDQRPKVIQFIAGQIPATFGIERLNAAHSLMRLAFREDLPNLPAVADTAGQAIAEMHRSAQPVLTQNNIEGGWNLAAASDGQGATTLKETILSVLEQHPDWDATYLYDQPLVALGASNDKAIAVLARELTGERVADVTDRLEHMEADTAEQVLNTVRVEAGNNLAQLINSHSKRLAQHQKAVEEAEAAGTEPDPATIADPVTPVIQALETLAAIYINDDDDSNNRPSIGWLLAYILMVGNNREARNAVSNLLPRLGMSRDARTITELLQAVQKRSLDQWPAWLGAIDLVGLQQNHASLIGEVAMELFTKATDIASDVTDVNVDSAVDDLARITESDGSPDLRLTNQATELLREPVTTEEEAQRRNWALSRVGMFVNSGHVEPGPIAVQEIATMRQTVAYGFPLQPDNGPLPTYLITHAPRIATALENGTDEQVADCIALARETQACGWLNERLRTQTAVAILANLADAAATVEAVEQCRDNAPDLDEMSGFVTAHGSEAARAIADWIRLMRPDQVGTQRVLQIARDQGALTDEVAKATRNHTTRWADDEQLALVRHFVATGNQDEPDPTFLHAIGYAEISPTDLAELLTDRFETSSSNGAKNTVISYWEAAPEMGDQSETLYKKILMPWLEANVDGNQNIDAAHRALSAAKRLAVPVPDSLRSNFSDLVARATEGNKDLTKTAIPALEALGYSASQVGFLHKRLEIEDDNVD